jgi:hypothetical protein
MRPTPAIRRGSTAGENSMHHTLAAKGLRHRLANVPDSNALVRRGRRVCAQTADLDRGPAGLGPGLFPNAPAIERVHRHRSSHPGLNPLHLGSRANEVRAKVLQASRRRSVGSANGHPIWGCPARQLVPNWHKRFGRGVALARGMRRVLGVYCVPETRRHEMGGCAAVRFALRSSSSSGSGSALAAPGTSSRDRSIRTGDPSVPPSAQTTAGRSSSPRRS